jgi:hypothetical protein
MSFVLIVAGIVLLVSAVRDTQQYLFFLVAGDFLGANNFIYWFLSIVAIGAIGYVPRLKPISDGFLILVILTLFLRKGAFFDQFQRAIASTQASSPRVSATSGGSSFVTVNQVGGGGSGPGIGVNAGGGGVNVGPGGVTISPPRVGVGPVTIQPPTVRF